MPSKVLPCSQNKHAVPYCCGQEDTATCGTTAVPWLAAAGGGWRGMEDVVSHVL